MDRMNPLSPAPLTLRRVDARADKLLREQVSLRQIRLQVGLMLPTEHAKFYLKKPAWELLSLDACLKILPTVHKISLLFGAMDIKPTYTALGLDGSPLLLTTDSSAEAHVFYHDVRGLTEGVVTVHELNRYGLLKSLLFSAIGRCQQLEGCSEILAKLERLFRVIDADFNAVDSWPEMTADIDAALDFFKKNCPESEKERVLRYLGIFKKAVSQPLLYMPQLMTRVQTQYLDGGDEEDMQTIDGEAIQWLEELLASWKLQFQRFSASFTHNKRLAGVWQQVQQDSAQAIQRLKKAIVCLKEYEALPAPEQRGQVERLSCNMLQFEYLEQPRKNLAEHFEQLRQLCADNSQFEKVVANPYHYFDALYAYSVRAIQNSAKCYQTHFEKLDRLLHPQFRTLSDITVIDLYHLQLDQYLHDEISPSEWSEIENLNMDSKLTDLLCKIHRVFERMRHTFAQRGNLSREEFLKSSQNIQAVAHVLQEAANLLKQTRHPKAVGLLKLCYNVADSLMKPLATDRWPQMFSKSPFAKTKVKLADEQAFYLGFLAAMRSEILEFRPQFLMMKILGHVLNLSDEESVFASQLLRMDCQLVKSILSFQNHLKERPKLTLDNLENEIYDFRETLTLFVREMNDLFESVERPLAEYIASTPACSDACRQLQAMMVRGRKAFDSNLLSPTQIFLNYLHRRERQKIKTPAVEVSVPPSLPIKVPTKPSPKLCQTFQDFERYCSAFAHLCLEFTPVGKKGEAARMTQHQHEHAANLLEKLPAMRELVRSLHAFGNHPFVAISLYLRMAVAMEQVGKMVTAVLKVPVKEKGAHYDILKLQGRECPWVDHSPHLFANLLQGDKALLTAAQKECVLSLSRVIAISSRYPVSGHDKLFETVQRLLKGEGNKAEECHQLEQELQTAMEACIALMKKALPEIEHRETKELSLPLQLESSLQPVGPVDKSWRKSIAPLFHKINERLKSIQHYRAIDNNCQIPAVGDNESRLDSRMRTIQVALNDLECNLRLIQDLLLSDEAPELCLTFAEEAALRQSVLLEHVLLILASHLPLRALPDSQNHFLWDERDARPSRYSHNLEEFTKKLEGSLKEQQPLLQETRALAAKLQPILQHLYRYHSTAPSPAKDHLERFKALSCLREQMPTEQLDTYIRQSLIHEVKLPALQLLQVVDRWLELYEQQLYKV